VKSGYFIAPNGGVMRTSILGTMEYHDIAKVLENTKNACKVTHADSRCVASCVAVTLAIALMLQGKYNMKNGEYDVDAIIKEAHAAAEQELEKDEHVGISTDL
jgi:ADP-ribosylglycohydrolase